MALSPGFSDELQCSVCLETFNTPILLPCAHTFCKQCLLNVHERSRIRGTQRGQNLELAGHSNNERPLVCPQCRIEITLGPEGINGLPKNTSLANIILSLEEVKKAKNIVCEVCDDEPARAASKTCSDCAVTYCTPCFRELHPMRGAFKYHVIKEANVPMPRCTSPVFDNRLARFTPSRGDGYGTDGTESGDDSGSYGSQDCLEVIRKQIKSKRKELNSVSKTLQNVLKTTEEETEERMREIRSTCSQINEEVGEKEATLLTAVSQKRHEAVRQCLALSSEVKAQTLTLDLLEDQVNDIMALRAVHTGTDVSNDIECLKEKIGAIQSRALTMKAKVIPRQAKLGNTELFKHISDLDFVKENTLLSPVLTEINLRPVSVGCAMAEVKWRPMDEVSKFRLSASKKDPRGIEVTTSVELSGSMTSYLLLLPESDAEYYVTLVATTEEGVNHPQVGRAIRTLPVVHCFRARFNPAACHKRMAVSSSRDEVVHRKCKVASLHNACAMTTSFYRLEHLEGTPTEDSLPLLPYVYWESVIHFHVFGKLGNSKLLCDIGVCKQGSEDSSSLLCDNSKSYCSYLVRRNNRVVLEFWNGPNRDTLARSIPVLDLDQETEKTIKLGFYFDALRRVFAVISPGNNSVLCQFQVKFPNLVPVCALYCFDHVYVMIKIPEPTKLPTVLSRLIRGGTPA